MKSLRYVHILACTVLLIAVAKSSSGQIISPAQPDIWPGGRGVAVTVHPANSSIAVVAAESGGLFKTTDAGATWTHLDGLLPFRIIDVKYSLVNSQLLIVTALQNGRITRGGGIWRSTNGGRNWQKPVTGEPTPSAECSVPVNAYGISVQIGRIFVGTDCGVAVSRDSGATWTHVSPVPAGSSQRIFAVLAQPNNTVVACGDSGVFRSTTNGTSWGSALPGVGPCTQSGPHLLAASPIEPNVLFVTTSPSTLMESDDGGQTWTSLNPPPPTGGRPSFVKTHLSADGDPTHFDIYFGNAYNVVRQTCTSGLSGLRCSGSWNGVTVGPNETPHDPNDLTFGATGNSPRFLLSDSGIYITADGGATFTVTGGGRAGYNALQIYDVAGQIHPDHTDVYFGTMDNCLWASANDAQTWMNPRCEEGFNLQMKRRPASHDDQIIVGVIPTRGNFWTSPHFVDYNNWNNPPNGIGNPFLIDTNVYMQYTTIPNSSANGLALTIDKGMTWNQIMQPNSTTPLRITGGLQHWPQVSASVTNPVVYQAVSRPGRIGLVRIDVDIAARTATLADADVNGLGSLGSYCMGQATFVCPVVWGMDANDPSHLIAPDVQTGQMKVSRNSGHDWTVDASLTNLVTDAGQIPFSAGAGVKVHAIGFDPDTSGRILVGTEAAGIFHSTDNGQTWSKISFSDFFIRGMTSFFFDTGGSVLVSTYGRGLWRIDPGSFPPPTLCGRTRPDCRVDIRDLAGDFIHLFKNPCPRAPDPPTCHFVDVDRGVIRDFGVDRNGTLNRIAITGGGLRAYDHKGKRIPVDINVPFSRPAARTEFTGCEACRNILSEGRTITGFIHNKGKVLGIISQYRGAADRRPAGKTIKDKFEESSETVLQLVGSLPITGHAAALNGDSIQVYGVGFCSKTPCPTVTLRVNNRVLAENVQVNGRGEFQATFVVTELPGRYRLTATSSSSGKLQRRGVGWFIVPTADRGEGR